MGRASIGFCDRPRQSGYPRAPFSFGSQMSDSADPRAIQARQWAQDRLGLEAADFAPASADASFRRYFRIQADGQSWILMDAPPQQEDSRPFVRIAQLMQGAGLNVPRVLHQDLQRGFLLLSDLGKQTYLNVLKPENADQLFSDAIDALIRWQCASVPGVLPEYDRALLQRELSLFPDWFVQQHLQTEFTAAQKADWRAVCDLLLDRALQQPKVFVHRDFMPRNLMRSEPNPGVLDFQDAVYGPISYDPVCLFKDAFVSWPEADVMAWRKIYTDRARKAGLPIADDAQFAQDFDWMGVQRHLKVLGIFARIRYRDGKPHYLQDAPRFLRYVCAVAQRDAPLLPLLRLFDQLGLQA